MKNDHTISEEKREKFKDLHKKLKNAQNFFNLLATKSALEEALVPYQKYGQLEKMCVLDRTWARQKLKLCIENVGDALSENINKHLEKLDFAAKRWKKSKIHCNRLPTEENAKKMIVAQRKKILDTFQKEKDDIHEKNDPKEIELLSKVFDMRLWDINVTLDIDNDKEEIETEIENLKIMMKTKLEEAEGWLIGEDIPRVLQGLGKTVDLILKNSQRSVLISKLQKQQTIQSQWKLMREFVELKEENDLWNTIERLTCIPNSEAGCERANSKYNLSKNRLSATMKLPMILARNRAGTNGPPLHLFDPKPVLQYWKQNHHRLAQKAKENDPSRVLNRMRRKQEETYTSKIYLS